MPNKKNLEIVSRLREDFADCSGLVFFDYRGTTVAQLTELRRELAKNSASLKVCKNSLIEIALRDSGRELNNEMFVNPTAVIFAKGELPAVAKIINEVAKKNDKIKIKGGYMGKDILDANSIRIVADIPSRDVLLSHLVMALQAPISGFANSMHSIISELAYVLDSVEDEKKRSA